MIGNFEGVFENNYFKDFDNIDNRNLELECFRDMECQLENSRFNVYLEDFFYLDFDRLINEGLGFIFIDKIEKIEDIDKFVFSEVFGIFL